MKTKLMLTTIAVSLALSTAVHAEEFSALQGVPAAAMSQSEMAVVQGKYIFSLWSPFYNFPRYSFNGALWSPGVQNRFKAIGYTSVQAPPMTVVSTYQNYRQSMNCMIFRNAGLRC
jgi:hypothetical protein